MKEPYIVYNIHRLVAVGWLEMENKGRQEGPWEGQLKGLEDKARTKRPSAHVIA